jgi:lauroyl/myristoyl acyltransferase
MPAGEQIDLDALLAEADRVAPLPRMPPAPLRVRIKTSLWLRRLIPTRLVVRRAEARARRLWAASPTEREEATEAMEKILARTPRAGELAELAEQHLLEQVVETAYFWQPWPKPRIDAVSLARLRAAYESDRGALFSACHMGPYHCTSHVALNLGYKPYVVAGSWYFEPLTHDYWGRRLARWRRAASLNLVDARGSYPVLRALLERGESVLLYYDMPGRRESRFLGKPAMLADGIARLAVETESIVLPVRMLREGHRKRMQVGEPLDGRDYRDVGELHEALGAVFERWILEFPAGMDDPGTFGWKAGARPEEWAAPAGD